MRRAIMPVSLEALRVMLMLPKGVKLRVHRAGDHAVEFLIDGDSLPEECAAEGTGRVVDGVVTWSEPGLKMVEARYKKVFEQTPVRFAGFRVT